jgi:hypothetical protein
LIGKKSGLTFGGGFSDSAIGVPGEHVRTLTKWHLLREILDSFVLLEVSC